MKWLEDETRPWYDQPEDTCDYIEYTIGDVKIMVGTIPNLRSWTKETFASIDAWLNISERLFHNPAPRQQWCPWDIAANPPLETIYASLRLLDYWIKGCGCKRIYINCIHGGTRSPAIFGFYLKAYHPNDIEKILATSVMVRRSRDNNPVELADTYMDDRHGGQKELAVILPAIATHTLENWNNLEEITHGFEKILTHYRWERLVNVTLPVAFKKFWWEIKFGLKYGLTRPFRKAMIWTHKKLNTARGRAYKKARL